MNWDEMIQKLNTNLQAVEYELVVNIYNEVAREIGEKEIDMVWDENLEEEMFYEQEDKENG